MALTEQDIKRRDLDYRDQVHVSAAYNPMRMGVELWVYTVHQDPQRHDGAAVVSYQLQDHDPRGAEQSPAVPLVLREEAAQKLMDDLWNAGLRPKNLKDDSRLVETLQEALTDAKQVRDMALPLALSHQTRARVLVAPEGMLSPDMLEALVRFVEGKE